MKTELKQIINDLKEVIKETKINVRDEILFQEAVKIHLTKEIGNQKKSYTPYPKRDFTKKEYPKSNNSSPYTSKEEPATDKQKYALKQAGMTIPAGLTKKKASEYIKEIKG